MVHIPAMTLKAIHCHHYMPSGVANQLQVVVSFFFGHSYLFLCQHQQPAQSSLACHIQLAGGSACLVEHRGDWKWLREAYGLKAHWSAETYVCHLCNAKSAKNTCRWSRILVLYFNQICLEPLSPWICFLRLCVFQPQQIYWFGLSLRWTQLTHHFPRRPPKMLWTMYSSSAMLKWFSLLVSNLIYNGVSENGECTCRQ